VALVAVQAFVLLSGLADSPLAIGGSWLFLLVVFALAVRFGPVSQSQDLAERSRAILVLLTLLASAIAFHSPQLSVDAKQKGIGVMLCMVFVDLALQLSSVSASKATAEEKRR
jgi:hypothetical protein